MPERDGNRGGSARSPWWLLGIPGAYFGFFTAIVIDELVLRTFLFSGSMPDWFVRLVELTYAPLIWMVKAIVD